MLDTQVICGKKFPIQFAPHPEEQCCRIKGGRRRDKMPVAVARANFQEIERKLDTRTT